MRYPASLDTLAASASGSGLGTVNLDTTLPHMAGILGYAAYTLMVSTVAWGILLHTRLVGQWVRRTTQYGGHMLLAILSVTLSVLHASVHMFRRDQIYGLTKVWLPWLGGANTKVSVGILGLELVAVVAFSIWLQRRLGYRRWHHLHWLSYPGFVLVAVHSVWACREQQFGFIWAAIAGSLTSVMALTVLRVLRSASRPGAERWFDLVEEYRDDL